MTIPNFSLRFEPDPRTDLPHLVDEHGILAGNVHAAWEAELKARCNNQSLRAGEEITFQTAAKNLPRQYRVRAVPGTSNRMPTYFLDPIDPMPAADQTLAWGGRTILALNGATTPATRTPMVPAPGGSNRSWIVAFLDEVDRLISDSNVDRYGLHGLQVLRDELRDVSEKHSHELLIVLMAGFALSGMLACANDPAETRRGRYYELALEALNPALRNVAVDSGGGISALVGAFSRVLGLGRGG